MEMSRLDLANAGGRLNRGTYVNNLRAWGLIRITDTWKGKAILCVIYVGST